VESCFINIDIYFRKKNSYLRQHVCGLNFQATNVGAELLN